MSQGNEKMETPKGRGQIRKRDEISPNDESIILTQDAISPEEVEIIKKHRENQKKNKKLTILTQQTQMMVINRVGRIS